MSIITSSEILHHTSAFIFESLSQSDLRHRLFSTFRNKIPSSEEYTIKPLNLAAETLENSIITSNSSVKSSSLRLAEKLLLSYPKNLFSSFLLSLIYTLCNRPMEASLSLLDIFHADPSFSRSEISPFVFQELFLIHFLPVLQWYNEQRSRILSSLLCLNSGYDSDDQSIKADSMVVSCSTFLLNTNGGQATELKELERNYEEVLDQNCRNFVGYFRDLLENKDAINEVFDLPLVVLETAGEGDSFMHREDEKTKSEESGLKNGRYNPIWAEGEKSADLNNSRTKSLSKFPSLYPERVSPRVLTNQNYSKPSPRKDSDSDLESVDDDDPSSSTSSDSDIEIEEKNKKIASFDSKQNQFLKQKQQIFAEPSHLLHPPMEDVDNSPSGGKLTPPKDFVCPITTHIFDDPVTLETGQTYERKAIQEWIETGNSTCPITRQKLHGTQLPKTNYVLKRLIATWRELNADTTRNESEIRYPDHDEPMFSSTSLSTSLSTSPNSVISQAIIDGTVNELRLVISNLCMSEILKESEMAVLRIERFWQEASMEVEIQTMLTRPPVINGFVEILFNSIDTRVLRATIFLLSELGSRDSDVIQTLTRVDSDAECIVALFKKGLFEAIVLIYLLKPSTSSLIEMDMSESLLTVIRNNASNSLNMCVEPKAASVLLLRQILGSDAESILSKVVRSMVSGNAIESIVRSLESEWKEERIATVGILLRCMQEDGRCRNIIADKAELAPVLESFAHADDGERYEMVQFLSELVKLNRRTFNEQVLHIIKDEGTFSTMHTLLTYLQTAIPDQCPVIAGLLLQLDLLVEPRKMSIYREEAIDSLISCLRNSDFPSAQIAAAETIVALQGRFSSSGRPLARAFLLKRAGLDKTYKSVARKDQLGSFSGDIQETTDEESAAEEWERKMAFVLVSHEFGLLFEALADGLKSRYAEVCSACFVSATWLVHMLTLLPDTGVLGAARVCLLKRFVSIFKSAKDTDDKALSMLALSTFIHNPDGMRDLTVYMKDILKGLREFKKSSAVAFEMLKVFSEGSESSADLWNHKELAQEDCSVNGVVLSVVSLKEMIFSGHSDGTIKVWIGKGSNLRFIQESQEHTKAVTSLTVSLSEDTLYSGSLDKTVRVWSINKDAIHCEKVYDVKDNVSNLLVANNISCFIPQGAGIKVHSWNGASKLLNPSKYVKCLDLVQGKLYCGCQDSSIQEIDLATGTLSSIQTGSRKLLTKPFPVYALKVQDGLIYSASYSLEGTAFKIWSATNYSLVGSFSSSMEVRSMAINGELIYLGCKGGTVEVWSRKKLCRKETLHTGTNGKVLCMSFNSNEDLLVIGTSDGKIHAWGVS